MRDSCTLGSSGFQTAKVQRTYGETCAHNPNSPLYAPSSSLSDISNIPHPVA